MIWEKWLRRFWLRKHSGQTRIISIIGTTSGCGVTHFSLTLGNYLANVKAARVAIVAMEQSGHFDFLKRNGQKLWGKGYEVKRISIYSPADEATLTEVINSRYEYVILVLGTEYQKFWQEFLRGSLSIVMCNLSEWKKQSTYAFLGSNHTDILLKNIAYLYIFGTEKEARVFEKYSKSKVKQIPFETNPLCINPKNLCFYQTLLKEILQ